jgi:glycosyl transferase family 25
MRLLDVFDHVFVINLPERTDRRKQAEGELRRLAGELPSKVSFLAAARPNTRAGFESVGAHGCFASHLLALRQARAAGMERVLVLEDDFRCTRTLLKHQGAFSELVLARDWDLLWLGHDLSLAPAEFPVLASAHQSFGLSHGYAVQSACLDDLVPFLEAMLMREPGHPEGGPMHYDGALATYRARRPERPFLLTRPSLLKQRMTSSDITARPWDRLPLLRHSLEALRALRGRLRELAL